MIETAKRYCLECDYNLYGLPLNRCPECGQEFDPNDFDTFVTAPLTPWQRFRRRYSRPVLVFAGVVMGIQVLAFVMARWLSDAYVLANFACLTAILFPMLMAVFPIPRRERLLRAMWRFVFAMFLFSPLLAICDGWMNLGLPVGRHGRVNATRSYVESFPGVKVIDLELEGSGPEFGPHWAGPFWLTVLVNGNTNSMLFSDAPLWVNYEEADLWYAWAKAMTTQPASSTTN